MQFAGNIVADKVSIADAGSNKKQLKHLQAICRAQEKLIKHLTRLLREKQKEGHFEEVPNTANIYPIHPKCPECGRSKIP